MIYANNAGTSWPKPPPVHEAVAEALATAPDRHAALLDTARQDVCSFLGISSLERFVFTPGCTSALSVLIDDLPWEEGDEVVTSSLEHQAVIRPVWKLERQRGVRHSAAPYRASAPIDLDFVRERLRAGRVRLVAISAASNVTGEVLPVRELVALAHEHGALCLVDAAQAVGMLPFDVGELGADLIAFAGHKGPRGPQGTGGLWAAPHVGFESPAAVCSLDGAGPTPDRASPFPGYCDVGGANVAGAVGVAAGMRWLRGSGETGDAARAMAARLHAEAGERTDCRVFGSPAFERTATVSIRLDALPVERAEAFFAARGIAIRAGQHCAPQAVEAIGAGDGTLRFSFGPVNAEADVDAILAAIDAV